MRWLAFIALALGVLSVLFLLGLVARRFWLEREERRRRAVTDRLRPSMFRLIDGDDREGRELQGQEAEFFAAQLARYAGSLRGEARHRITRWFEESGAVSTEIGRLRDRRAWRRATAAFALGNMGSRTAVPALVLALKDRNKDVRSAAVRSLGRLRAAEAIEPVVEVAVERRVPRSVVSAAALEVGAPVVPFLLRLLGHERPAVRCAAVELIGLLDVGADSAPLVARLRDPAPEVRAASALALERIADAVATDALMAALRDDEALVRAAAAAALGRIGGDETVEALLSVARHDSFDPARAAAHAAAGIAPARLREAAATSDAGPFLREAADLATL